MTMDHQDVANPLKGLGQARSAGGRPPVHLWNPPFCGNIDMRIAADGTWYYLNSPIGRKPLVQLFASVLRREPDGSYCLVTPVERVGIKVEDAPFTAVRMQLSGTGDAQTICFETNVEDRVTVGSGHPLRFAEEAGTGGLKPYVLVRPGLEALVTRALFYDLVAAGSVCEDWFGVWSSGEFFAMQKASDIGVGV
ncbi:DUF1285 domain-containing protein [Aestuariivirga sp.]|jgi:hypothetical protein|uniref:DUF1285 domain-containing protein n=1 Tax=Aestuariivirga sp. TaxID=2650926 RepID=UPI003784D47C